MSWLITPQYLGAAVSDADAQAYLRAVETADNQGPLEQGVQQAVNQFVIGCKADGIWTAIKASCVLAGARTLAGALVPLVGIAPTNNNFVSGDYNRKTGLVGDGSSKYLNSNRNNNADPQNSQHLSAFVNTVSTPVGWYMGTGFGLSGTSGFARRASPNASTVRFRCRSSSSVVDIASGASAGFYGVSRTSGSAFNARAAGLSGNVSGDTSETPASDNVLVFTSSVSGTLTYDNPRLAFYSIGESLNLALLDARVTTLIQAIGAAI